MAACSTSCSTCSGSASSRPRWSSCTAAVGIRFTLGASGAVFGLLGAMVAYGRSRGGAFGVAVLQQYGRWALFMFLASFFLAGVNNWGHAGGYVTALAVG